MVVADPVAMLKRAFPSVETAREAPHMPWASTLLNTTAGSCGTRRLIVVGFILATALGACSGSPSAPGGGGGGGAAPLVWHVIVVGGEHYCGLVDSTAYCWGNQVSSSSYFPVPVQNAPPVIQIAAGFDFNCALTRAGKAYCWGNNFDMQLGDSLGGAILTPIPAMTNLQFSALTTGGAHTCGLISDGTAYCWGLSDALAPVHDGDTWIPQQMTGFPSFVSISAGSRHTCGATSAGQIYCWGSNQDGQLGIGQKGVGQATTPAAVTSSVLLGRPASGFLHSCALTSNGAAYCWGDNRFGNLGTGDTVSHFSAVPVAGNLQFTSLAAAATATCGLTASGLVYCWGTSVSAVALSPALVPTNIQFVSLAANLDAPYSGDPTLTCGVATTGRGYCWQGVMGTTGGATTGPSIVPEPQH
jgi:Regulator of Chromosome Condensation (RCC1) repeat protein